MIYRIFLRKGYNGFFIGKNPGKYIVVEYDAIKAIELCETLNKGLAHENENVLAEVQPERGGQVSN